MPARFRNGFTLLELAVVLTIIGLLVGGAMAGRSLLRSAEVRRVASAVQTFITAHNEFVGIYGEPPGDFSRATDIWGTLDPNPLVCSGMASTSDATCDGDGNGFIGTDMAPQEGYRAWQHLSNAKLIPDQFPGGGASMEAMTPPSGLPNTFWLWKPFVTTTTASNGVFFQGLEPGNYLWLLGSSMAPDVLTPTEAEAVDLKLDDGMPGTGKIFASKKASVAWPDCSDGNTPATARYDVAKTTRTCSMGFRVTTLD